MATTYANPAIALEIEVTPRNFDLNPRKVRAENRVPATVYSKTVGPYSIEVPTKAFYMAWRDGQKRFTLKGVEGSKDIVAKIQTVQTHPVSDQVLNIEFLAE